MGAAKDFFHEHKSIVTYVAITYASKRRPKTLSVVLLYNHENADAVASPMPLSEMRRMIRECGAWGVDAQKRLLECLEMPIDTGESFDLLPDGYEMPSLPAGAEIPVYVLVLEPRGQMAVVGCTLRNPAVQRSASLARQLVLPCKIARRVPAMCGASAMGRGAW